MKQRKQQIVVICIITIILFFSNIAYASTTDTFTVTIKPSALLLYDEIPAKGATNIGLSPTLTISCLSLTNKTMNLSWYWGYTADTCNNLFGVNNSINNGTFQQTNLGNFSNYDTIYYWFLNLTDEDGKYITMLLYFTTTSQSGFIIITGTQNSAYAIVGVVGIIGLLGLFLKGFRKKKENKGDEI